MVGSSLSPLAACLASHLVPIRPRPWRDLLGASQASFSHTQKNRLQTNSCVLLPLLTLFLFSPMSLLWAFSSSGERKLFLCVDPILSPSQFLFEVVELSEIGGVGSSHAPGTAAMEFVFSW